MWGHRPDVVAAPCLAGLLLLRRCCRPVRRHGVRVLRTTEFFQGKTSRWALSWSFAAPPLAASQPLPRFPAPGGGTAGPKAPGASAPGEGRAAAGSSVQERRGPAAEAGAGVGRPSRRVSWQVQGPPAAGPTMLQAAQAALQQAGVLCQLDAAAFTLRISHQSTGAAEQAAAAEAAERAAKRHKKQAQQQQQQQGAEPAMRPTQEPWRAELQLFMQHAGMFALVAMLHRATPDAALGWWAGALVAVRQALAERWKVSS